MTFHLEMATFSHPCLVQQKYGDHPVMYDIETILDWY